MGVIIEMADANSGRSYLVPAANWALEEKNGEAAPPPLDTKNKALKQLGDKARALYDYHYATAQRRKAFEAHAAKFEHGTALVRIYKIGALMRRQGQRKSPVSNASLKILELLSLLEELTRQRINISVHFDNAALPGGWILAVEEWARSRDIAVPQWYASSWLGEGALVDKYDLVKRHPDRWLMLDENGHPSSPDAGDMCKTPAVAALVDRICEKMSGAGAGGILATSDLGFGLAQDDYQHQEALHSLANLGQCITLLSAMLCRPSSESVFIMKQFTMYEPFTISLMALLSHCFETPLRVIKPFMSKAANQEMYLVGRGINVGPATAALKIMIAAHSAGEVKKRLVIYDEQFATDILSIQTDLVGQMTDRIDHIMSTSRNPAAANNVQKTTCREALAWMAKYLPHVKLRKN